MFSVKMFTWAEKAMGFTGNTHGLVPVQFQMGSHGKQFQEASELLCEGSMAPCGVVSWMKFFQA